MSSVKVVTEFNKDIIQQYIKYSGFNDFGLREHIAKDIIALKEQGIREALIRLGWTPPADETEKENEQ